MPDLTDAQREAVAHRGGPLVVLGGAGSGKTTTLVARFAQLVEAGTAPDAIAVLAPAQGAADDLRTAIEDALGERAFGELAVHTATGLARRLLRSEALEAPVDPFAALASPADRLGVLLERMDDLPLRHHDLQGRPAATLARIIARIDRCKHELVSAEALAAWAHDLDVMDARAPREREFAALYAAHDRMLAEQGLIDGGELVVRAHALLAEHPHVRARAGARFRHVLVDDAQDHTPAALALAHLLGDITLACDDDQAVTPPRSGPAGVLRAAVAQPGATTIRLERSLRCRARVLQAAHAVIAPTADRVPKRLDGTGGGAVRFWRCANERAQAQSAAAEIERLIRDGVAPEQIGVLVRSVRNEGQAVTVALEERAIPFRILGGAAFFQRAEVRDVLAWLRLLVDPGDAAAVVRALARPPIELRSVDLARCVQISKRRKLDMVGALVAATESPQVPPEARDRIIAFLKLHKAASGALDTTRPDLFVHRLIDRLGLRRQQLFAAQSDVVERLVALARLGELAADHVRRAPQATARDFARYLAAVAEAGLQEDEETAAAADGGRARTDMVAVASMAGAKGLELDHVFVLGLQASRVPGARMSLVEPVPDIAGGGGEHAAGSRDRHVADMRRLTHLAITRARKGVVLAYAASSERGARQPPSPFAEEARAALGAGWEDREEELFGPDEALHATFSALRDELLGSVATIGSRLGEMRFDTDLDVTHGVVRYLELVKLAALIERPGGQSVDDALVDINARLLQATSAQQREVFLTSTLDDFILGAERDESARAHALAAREEPSLEAFLPRRGDGLMLSASDIETYRSCPLRYKFARVFRIPSEPTLNQRFGIVVHQALERFHAESGRTLDQLQGLLDAAWRRSGLGVSDQERQLHAKAVTAMQRYQERFVAERSEPVWLEKGFQFKLGPHVLRGRVDRVDRLEDGGYELIDYKTGRPKSAAQLREDVQLSLYAIGAREAWEIDAPFQAYHYVLDDQKIAVPTSEIDPGWITDTVMEVGEGILSQGFEPTPSYSACSMCDYRIACPAAER